MTGNGNSENLCPLLPWTGQMTGNVPRGFPEVANRDASGLRTIRYVASCTAPAKTAECKVGRDKAA